MSSFRFFWVRSLTIPPYGPKGPVTELRICLEIGPSDFYDEA